MSATPIDRLRQFASQASQHSTCDLCRSELADNHRHLLEVVHRRMLCVCDACAMLFSDVNGSRFRPIPRNVTQIELNLSDEAWSRLGIPIGMAYFTVRASAASDDQAGNDDLEATAAPVVVAYPSPAGPVMSSVQPADWNAIGDTHPELQQMRPEVESLLINRTTNHHQAFITSIDICHELVGIVRRHWQGWSGGPTVHREIDRFFDQLETPAIGAPLA